MIDKRRRRAPPWPCSWPTGSLRQIRHASAARRAPFGLRGGHLGAALRLGLVLADGLLDLPVLLVGQLLRRLTVPLGGFGAIRQLVDTALRLVDRTLSGRDVDRYSGGQRQAEIRLDRVLLRE